MVNNSLILKVIYLLALCYAFFLAGFFQFFGLLGVTGGTTFLTIICILFFVFQGWDLKIKKYNFITIIFFTYILISGILNHKSLAAISLYLLYIIIPIVILNLSQIIRKMPNKILKYFFIISIIQLPIMLVQKLFGKVLGQISKKHYAEIDSVFGSFPVADDHGLGMLFLSVSGVLLFKKENSFFEKIVFIINIMGIILIESNTTKLFFVALIGVYFFDRMGLKFKLNFKYILFAFIFLYYVLFKTDLIPYIGEIFNFVEFRSLSMETSFSLVENGTAGRLQTLIYLFNQPLLIIGNGPFSYFDPFTYEFAFNPNFSQFIWFYYDLGIIGVLMFMVWIVNIYKEVFKKKNSLSNFLFFAFLLYSLFTTSLNSITMLVIFFAFQFYIQETEEIKVKHF